MDLRIVGEVGEAAGEVFGVTFGMGIEEEEEEEVEGVVVEMLGGGEGGTDGGGGAPAATRREEAVGSGGVEVVGALLLVVDGKLPVVASVGPVVEVQGKGRVGVGEWG